MTDIPRIKQLIEQHITEGFLLPRPLSELYETRRRKLIDLAAKIVHIGGLPSGLDRKISIKETGDTSSQQ